MLEGQPISMISSRVHTNRFWRKFWHDISTHGEWVGEICNIGSDGTPVWLWTSITPVMENGTIKHFRVRRKDSRDIGSRKEDIYSGRIDPITLLPNQNKLIKVLHENP